MGFLGGQGEIGKNCAFIEHDGQIVVIDCGLTFPEEDAFGIDIVLPDLSYLVERGRDVRALFITHGHEDHIGAVPYLLRDMSVPVYGSRLVLGFLGPKLEEMKVRDFDGRLIEPGQTVSVGPFEVVPFRVNHSIPDAWGFAVKTPVGTVVHTGDFKFDQTPVDGQVTDFQTLGQLGREGVLILMMDSTNAERPGYTASEKVVGRKLREILWNRPGRILVTTFASNVHRIQQVFDAAGSVGRKVAVVGRSMADTVRIASELDYLRIPPNTLTELEELSRLPDDRVVVLTTGSQGEPMSALARIAAGDFRKLEIKTGDTVVIAATPVPGNETLVARTVDLLFRQGADVIYEATSEVHVSGHASQEELKAMMNILAPRFFVPVHGEWRHMVRSAQLARDVGIADENIFLVENGSVLEFTRDRARVAGKVQSGQVLVDGLGVGDVGDVVMRDRRQLAQDGIVLVSVAVDPSTGDILSGPELISRGFVYARESEELIEEAKERVSEMVSSLYADGDREWPQIKGKVRHALASLFHERTRRRPMVVPVILEVDSRSKGE
ncbi:MAG TPA: ribonuclease J [Clostridiales bacterium]|nr:ribonuclease J [Clostridiales bacterium]